MQQHIISTLRRKFTAQERARQLQARFFPFGRPTVSVERQQIAAEVATQVGCVLASQLCAEPGGEIYDADGHPILVPVEPRDIDAPLADYEPVESNTTPISFETFESLSPSIEADIASVETSERYAFDLGRARANFACLTAEKARLSRAIESVRAAGQSPAHLCQRIQDISDRMHDLELEWWPEELAPVSA